MGFGSISEQTQIQSGLKTFKLGMTLIFRLIIVLVICGSIPLLRHQNGEHLILTSGLHCIRGLDFVSLEYNFVEPKIAANMSSSVHKVTQLRKPWDRFRSTFERELQLKCQSKKERSAKELCFSKNMDHTGLMEVTRQKEWPGILAPNYYVRMVSSI